MHIDNMELVVSRVKFRIDEYMSSDKHAKTDCMSGEKLTMSLVSLIYQCVHGG